MSKAIQTGETWGEAVQRALLRSLDAAREAIADGREDRVHEVRKRLKHVRSFLRLVSRAAPEGAAKRDRRQARDLARDLSSTRDAEAAVEAFDRLRREVGDEGLAPDVRDALIGARDRARAADAAEVDLAPIGDALGGLRERIAEWPLSDSDFSDLLPKLEATYRRGRRAHRRARAKPTVERLHEWRKHVKRHVEHLKVVRSLWPELIGPRKSAAADLGDTLGHDHDLALLAGRIHDERLRAAIERRRRELLSECLVQGGRLYAEKPRAFTRRLRKWEQVWRRG